MDGIHLSKDGLNSGPYTGAEVVALLRDQKFLPTDHYWREGMDSWQPLSELKIESVPKADSPRIAPLAVVIIARMMVIDAIWGVIMIVENIPVDIWIGYRFHSSFSFLPHLPLLLWLWMGIETVLNIGCGLALLRGKNFGRIGYVAIFVMGEIFAFTYHPQGFAPRLICMGIAFQLVLLVFLFGPDANRFFSGSGPVVKSERFGYECLIYFRIARGLMLFSLTFPIRFLFDQGQEISAPYAFLWIFIAAFSLIVFYIGLFKNKFYAWKETIAVMMALVLYFALPQMVKAIRKGPEPAKAIPSAAHPPYG